MIWGTLDPFVEEGSILGRRVANSTFLEALLQANPYEAYHFFLPGDASGGPLRAWLRERFPSLLARGAIVIDSAINLPRRLAETPYHCFHLSDIFGRYTKLAQTRNACAATIFPITGVTHSLSYTHFMPGYCSHLWPGVSSRDAVIVTSESARLAVSAIFSGLRQSYGLSETAFPSPALVTLPLGVALEDFPGPDDHWSKGGDNNPGLAMRQALGLGEDPVFLYFGRLCPSSKMDLMPLLAAFKRAESLGLPRDGYSLVLAGWADKDDPLPEALCSYARTRGIRAVHMDRPTGEQRFGLFAAADIFVSPSDNLQETFGLSVAEAGASGLPVIASDFDGYRDIVAHEETGWLIPTLGFTGSDSLETDALWWYDNQYHLRLAQESVVDVPALAEALALAGVNAEERRRMGEAGRRRIRESFSWDTVIKRYVALWDALASTPLRPDEEEHLRRSRHPQHMRFARYFRGHFSAILDDPTLENMRLKRTPTGEALYRGVLPTLMYAGMEHMLDEEAVKLLLLATRKTIPAKECLEALMRYFEARDDTRQKLAQKNVRENAEFTLLWCLKQDYVERTDSE